jgi:2-hydroxy-3-oxopropionate reductase
MENVGFIGLGAMGGPMAQNLQRKGFQLTVFDILQERMEPLKAVGADVTASSKEVAEKCSIVITMVPATAHVKEVVLGRDGVAAGIRPGSVLIEMSTIDPVAGRQIAKALQAQGVEMIDAPVARGIPAAVAGTLAIFVGGDEAVVDRCRSVLAAMGTDIHYVGGNGNGHIVKIVNNMMVGITNCALAESMVLGVKAGVSPSVLFEALSSGSANSFVLQNHFKNRVMKGDFKEGDFPIDMITKDLDLGLTSGREFRVPLHFTALAMQEYVSAAAAGESKNYFPAVVRPLERLTGVELRWEPKPAE